MLGNLKFYLSYLLISSKKIEDISSNPSSINSDSAVSDRYNGGQSNKIRLTSYDGDDDVENDSPFL